MDCGRARRLLWPPERPRIADPEVVAARQHLEGCAACRAHFTVDGILAEVRAGLRETVPVREIRRRVQEAVGITRTETTLPPNPLARHWRIVVGAILVAGLGLGALAASMLSRETAREPGAAFMEDYMRLAVREDHIVTTDSAEVRRFLLRELGAVVEVLDGPGFRIAGAEVCLLDARRGALIRYQTDAGIVSYYLLPAAGIPDRPPVSATRQAGTSAGLVTWARNGIERALVGALPSDTLLRLARRAR